VFLMKRKEADPPVAQEAAEASETGGSETLSMGPERLRKKARAVAGEVGNGASDEAAVAPSTASWPLDRCFTVRMYDGDLTQRQLLADEARALDPDTVDFHYDKAFGRIQIRARDKRIICDDLEIPGLGPVGQLLLTALMDHPGELLAPWEIVRLTGYKWFYCPNNISGRLSALRRAFGEDGNHPHFFLTRRHPYAVCWSGERTWRVIDKIRPQEADQ
jgi:hypothetical protein